MIWTLAKKDLRLLMRDRRAVVILLAMPFIFILVLGLSLGEGFGQKPDERMRVSLVDLDQGYVEPVALLREATARLTQTPCPPGMACAVDPHALATLTLTSAQQAIRFP